tara:strand:+ start:148 stop:1239 length:1092 start_codon:yes stop_codon:yes gene_type:complete
MFYLLVVFTSIYLVFILFIISGLFRHNILPVSNSETLPFVSVIIAARNEEENLPYLIDDLINQEYPLGKFEIIIVNDRSNDSTQNILIEASENYSFIKHVKIDKESKEMTPKKYAIEMGIKESKGEIILATDADCRVGSLWVSSMTYSLIHKNGIIIGYSEIDDKKGTLFEKYQKIDFLAIIAANAGAAGWNHYWSGTGQNLAYYKKDFLQIGGFEPVKDKISGDDMYLVQSISRFKNGYIQIDPNSHVKTKAMKSIKDFINQRIRWSSNSKSNFKNTPIFFTFLIVSFFENLLILFSTILFKQGYLIWGIKITLDGIIILFGSKLFEKSFDIKTYFIWAILQPFYIPLIGVLGLFNKFSWKK